MVAGGAGEVTSLFDESALELLRSFQLHGAARVEVRDAWLASPDGTRRCAQEARAYGARHGNSGAGLLLTMIRRGDHLQDSLPAGTDVLPLGYNAAREALAVDYESRAVSP